MLVKALAVSVIILSIYFLGIFFQRLISTTSEDKQGAAYHIGCYESQPDLNESKAIQQYLLNLSNQVAPYTNSEINKQKQKAAVTKVDTNAANKLALEFKKYITAYQNIKNLNQYEQSYNKGMRDAREDFLKCREDFLRQDWNCKGAYARYLETENEFTLIKSNLSTIVEQKYQQQHKIQKLLTDDKGGQQQDYENYWLKNQTYNKRITLLEQSVREKNETLIGLQNKEFKLMYDLNLTRIQVEQCQRNKKQLQTCKDIMQRLKQVFTGVDLTEIMNKIESKRKILQKYNTALVKSNKLGQDTTEIKDQIAKNTFQLNQLYQLYSQTEGLSICSGDFIKKCSDQHFLELQKNITNMQEILGLTKILRSEIKQIILEGQVAIKELNQLINSITEQYQNTIGSLEKIKQTQVVNQKKLVEHKNNINKFNDQISSIQLNINEADSNRRNAINSLDSVIGRVGALAQCLSKKEYLVKLQSKRPQRRQQDQKLKREAAEKLIKIMRSAYK